MADSVRIMCPNLKCRAILSVPDAARGRMVRCKQCGNNIRIPERKTQESAKPVEPKVEEKKAA